jgi:formylglycine-generating enzyme required for sulfatase activity/uncharacterized caspase-like protein
MIKNLLVVCLFSLLVDLSAHTSTVFAGTHIRGTAETKTNETTGTASLQRMALVVGNANYSNQPSLRTPRRDALAMAGLLRSMGFEVITLEDASRRELEQALVEFDNRLDETGIGLFYFAGHGLKLEELHLILPVDAQTGSAESVHRTGIDINHIARQMSFQRPNRTNLLIVDACLNNPFDAKRTAATVFPPDQTLIAFATSAGSVAFDGNGRHSIYTQELIEAMSIPGLAINEIFARVRTTVGQRTNQHQKPWTLSALDTSLHFSPYATVSTSTQPANRLPLPESTLSNMLTRGILPKDGEAQYELEFWQSVKDSTDAADYEAYLEAYPDGKFAPLARSRLKRYKQSAQQKPKPQPPAPVITKMDAEYEVTGSANIRQAPSVKATRIGKLKRGSTVNVTGRVSDNKWYQVKSATGITGFVSSDLLRKPAPKRKPEPKPERKPAPPVAAPAVAPASVKTGEIKTVRDCPTCPEMLVLQPATFTMGNNHGDRSEKPAHTVSIKRPFAIGKYEVTTGQWNECVKAGGCSHKATKTGPTDNSPITDISWNDAQQYVRWLSQLTKQKYRLPSEAEWEYAARAGTQSRFWWGDEPGTGQANCKNCGGKWDRAAPAETDAFPPNPFGLYGTSGGVWEWVADCWHKSYQGAPKDGSSWNKSDCRENVIRGGAWRNDTSYIHTSSRFKYDSNVRYLLNGFRVAKTLQ